MNYKKSLIHEFQIKAAALKQMQECQESATEDSLSTQALKRMLRIAQQALERCQQLPTAS